MTRVCHSFSRGHCLSHFMSVVKDKCAGINRLPEGGILGCSWIYESRMGCENGNISVLNCIETADLLSVVHVTQDAVMGSPFEEHKLVQRHPRDIFPLVVWIVQDRHILSLCIWVDDSYGKNVVFRVYTSIVAKGQWPLKCRRVYRSPQINDLKPSLQELRPLLWKMPMN